MGECNFSGRGGRGNVAEMGWRMYGGGGVFPLYPSTWRGMTHPSAVLINYELKCKQFIHLQDELKLFLRVLNLNWNSSKSLKLIYFWFCPCLYLLINILLLYKKPKGSHVLWLWIVRWVKTMTFPRTILGYIWTNYYNPILVLFLACRSQFTH